MHKRAVLTGLLLFASFSLLQAQTTNNNDSCDISLTPAATLLLPYFEVETTAPPGTGATTLFTVTNTSRYPQIAHCTVWTDWGYPVLNFNLFLTGYDVQAISLFDILVRGIIVPGTPSGTSITSPPVSRSPGTPALDSTETPLSNTANPNFITSGQRDVSVRCAGLPGVIQQDLAQAVKRALSTGTGYNSSAASCGTAQLGSNTGTRAKGYITIDVVSACTVQFPTDADGSYFAGPNAAILFDNVLTGDYQQIGPTPAGAGTTATFDAEGGPLVHIHAVPEGGLSGASGADTVTTNLPFTFYDRYTPGNARTADRRQPLPSVWAARYIQGGPGGFATDLKIWREGLTTGLPNCQTAPAAVLLNSTIAFHDIVRFDEHENAYGLGISNCAGTCGVSIPALPLLSRTNTVAGVFPTLTGNDLGGWFYLNLNSDARDGQGLKLCHSVLSAQRAGFGTCNGEPLGTGGSRTTSQSWVISSMFGAAGANRLAVDFDATALGNGCTPAPPHKAIIGPASQRNGAVCPKNASYTSCGAGTVVPPINP